jgi:hypothetical protein
VQTRHAAGKQGSRFSSFTLHMDGWLIFFPSDPTGSIFITRVITKIQHTGIQCKCYTVHRRKRGGESAADASVFRETKALQKKTKPESFKPGSQPVKPNSLCPEKLTDTRRNIQKIFNTCESCSDKKTSQSSVSMRSSIISSIVASAIRRNLPG